LISFEKELKNKLQAKSSGVQSEEQVLIKSFKYFDLNNNETVEPDEFAKAIEKIGIMIPTKQVSKCDLISIYLGWTNSGVRFIGSDRNQSWGRLDDQMNFSLFFHKFSHVSLYI